MVTTKNYHISGKTIYCPHYIATSKNGKATILSNAEKLCKSIESLGHNADYAASRMKKLTHEYKCSDSYIQKESDKGTMPDCNAYFYKELGQKFSAASKSVYNLKNQILRDINLNNVKLYSAEAKNSLKSLSSFTDDNLKKVNAAFDHALFDTNTAKYGTIFSMIFPPLALGIVATNSLFNNEFNGKVERALEDVNSVSESVSEIGQLLSHFYNSEIYA